MIPESIQNLPQAMYVQAGGKCSVFLFLHDLLYPVKYQ